MKKLILLFIIISSAIAATAQPLTRDSIVGYYAVSKLYLNDTLFYDKYDQTGPDKNILNEKIAPMNNYYDTMMVIDLYKKDISFSVCTGFTFAADSTVQTDKNSLYSKYFHTDRWVFNQPKQEVELILNGKVIERMKAKRVNGVITLSFEYTLESTKVELNKIRK